MCFPCRGTNVVAIDLIVEHIRTKLQQPELRRIYPNLELIPSNFQIQGMHTIIRDRKTSKEGEHDCPLAARKRQGAHVVPATTETVGCACCASVHHGVEDGLVCFACGVEGWREATEGHVKERGPAVG